MHRSDRPHTLPVSRNVGIKTTDVMRQGRQLNVSIALTEFTILLGHNKS